MRVSQGGMTMLVFLIIMFGLGLVYYRGLVANINAVGTQADNTLRVLQLRGVGYA